MWKYRGQLSVKFLTKMGKTGRDVRFGGKPYGFCYEYADFEVSEKMPLDLVSMKIGGTREGWRYERVRQLCKEESSSKGEMFEKGQSQTLQGLGNQARPEYSFTQIEPLE